MPAGSTPNDIEMAVTKHGFSRYPMRGEGGELVGYVHIKDLLRLGEDRIVQPIPEKRIREMLTLRDDTDLEDVLARMQGRGVHLARAVDASGTEMGVLFLEDVIEELVGEVHDATKRQRYE